MSLDALSALRLEEAEGRDRSHEAEADGGEERRSRRTPESTRPGAARTRRIGSAAVGAVLGSAFGFVLPFAIVGWFGSGRSTDAYFLTVGTILFLTTILSTVVEGVIVPFAMERKSVGRSAFRGFVKRTTVEVAAMSLACTILLGALVSAFIVPHLGLSADQVSRCTTFFLILLPLPALTTVNSTLAGCHYACHRYMLPTASVALRAGFALLAGLFLRSHGGLQAITVGLIAGELARHVLLVWSLRSLANELPEGKANQWSARAFWRTATPQALSMVIVGANPLIDKAFAAGLAAGGVTVLELAEKLFYVPMTIMVAALGLVSGAAWAELASGGDRQRLRADYWRTQRIAVGLALGVTVAAITALLVGSTRAGSGFGVTNLGLLGLTSSLFFVGLPFATVQELGVRLLLANKVTWLLPRLALVSLVLNVSADAIGARFFGVAGLAFASTIVRGTQAVFYLLLSTSLLRGTLEARP